jgi:hypothetical protein
MTMVMVSGKLSMFSMFMNRARVSWGLHAYCHNQGKKRVSYVFMAVVMVSGGTLYVLHVCEQGHVFGKLSTFTTMVKVNG